MQNYEDDNHVKESLDGYTLKYFELWRNTYGNIRKLKFWVQK
jgi:hypothetical protein